MSKRFLCLALLMLILMPLGIGCVNDAPSRNHPRVHPMHSVVFLNGNDTNNVDLLVRGYTDDLTLGDTLLHQFVAPGKPSDTVHVASLLKFRYTVYWADSSLGGGPSPDKHLAEYSYSDYRIFLDTDSAHYGVSLRGDVVTFTGSN
jgi:hypothetical protein